MATDNDTPSVQGLVNQKNLEYKEDIALIDATLDLLNARLSTGTDAGTEDGTVDSTTDTAVTDGKAETAKITVRIDALFPYVQQS